MFNAAVVEVLQHLRVINGGSALNHNWCLCAGMIRCDACGHWRCDVLREDQKSAHWRGQYWCPEPAPPAYTARPQVTYIVEIALIA